MLDEIIISLLVSFDVLLFVRGISSELGIRFRTLH
jgi:hypothetical protein